MQVSSSPPFFEHQHERLEAQLHAHLLDVVGGDFDSALQRLQRWRADLAQHIEIENTRLLPHVPPGARWARGCTWWSTTVSRCWPTSTC